MSTADLTAAIAAKERDVAAARLRLEALQKRLVEAERHSAEVRDLLGEGVDGLPLAMLPLYAALLGAVASNGALFFSFVVFLTRFHELIWNASLVVSLVLGVVAVPLASRPGAGGRSRVGLRRFTVASLVIAMLGVVATVVMKR